MTAPIEDPAPAAAVDEEPPPKTRSGFPTRPRPVPADDREMERGLRGLVGSGASTSGRGSTQWWVTVPIPWGPLGAGKV